MEPPQHDAQEGGLPTVEGDPYVGDVAQGGMEFPDDGFFDAGVPEGVGDDTAVEASTPFQEGDDLAHSPMPSDK